jgi:hypothetical protein
MINRVLTVRVAPGQSQGKEAPWQSDLYAERND